MSCPTVQKSLSRTHLKPHTLQYNHNSYQRTYSPHCTTIHPAETVLTTNGPANPFPNLAVP